MQETDSIRESISGLYALAYGVPSQRDLNLVARGVRAATSRTCILCQAGVLLQY